MSGLDLARALYVEVVGPALLVSHTACLIGEGFEVLGFDDRRSTDHEWGPRLQVFVDRSQVGPTRELVEEILPESFHGVPTRWFALAARGIAHHVEVDTVEDWLAAHVPTLPAGPDVAAWLAAPQQHLLQLGAGEVFCDDSGILTRRRGLYRWYPADVWRWMIAAQWHLIGNTTPLLGRAVEVGDVRGARLLTATLCRLVMEMVFLQQRRYRPYPKWFGTAFTTLPASGSFGPLLDQALTETPTLDADGPMQQALLLIASGHNELGITETVTPVIADFEVGVNEAVRPFPVLNTAAYIDATVASIQDQQLVRLPRVGAVDQLTHADDQLVNFTRWPADLAEIYRRMLTTAG